ncbi:hypothetical protein C8R44DRAFT_784877 [Mycena epipterygia]|nr:hypothetical protein C8R44DRAFT_784877 [Mycena epipterygia]
MAAMSSSPVPQNKQSSLSRILNPPLTRTLLSRQPTPQFTTTMPMPDGHGFNLGPVDWGGTPSTSPRHQSHSVAGPSRQYQAPSHVTSPSYSPRPEDMYPHHAWASDPFESPTIAPMYSDERTSGYPSYEHVHQQPAPYQQRGSPEIDVSGMSTWQTRERASTRLVAQSSSVYSNHQDGYGLPAFPPHSEDRTRPRQMVQKRGVVNLEDAEQPPKVKRKLSVKPREYAAPFGPNKRGNTTKKRSEAAQRTALNGNTVYTLDPRPRGKDRDETPFRVMPAAKPVDPNADANVVLEPQVSRCMSNRYKNEDFPRCVSCTRRWAGDTCRFQSIRTFCRDSDGNIKGFIFQENPERDAIPLHFPNEWNIPLDSRHIHETKKTIAAALLPTLHEELRHLNLPTVMYRPRENEVRATCDNCLTSIFGSSWMCRVCGRETCAECFEQVKSLSIEPEGGSVKQLQEFYARRDKHTHNNPFFLNCLKRNDHGAQDFSPMSRFSKPELVDAIRDMEQLLAAEGIVVNAPRSGSAGSDQGSTSNSSGAYTPPDAAPSPLSSVSEATLVSNGGDVPQSSGQPPAPVASGSTTEIPSHEIHRFKESDLTEEIFRPLWAQGDPLLVTNVGHKLKTKWSPEYFIEKYGFQNCLIIECQTDANKRTTVAEFFRDFGKYEGRTECWKLKDWPPSSDFKTSFPELYDDFSQAVPIPNYVRRDGVLNIASHFPSNTVGPDLGPKMYNANANREASDNKGSTRLHMDMADALNIMTYAATDPDGKEGRAAWDLFRAQDSDKIRQFLRNKVTTKVQDPIHSQQVYLDDALRRELWEEYGVKSYRVYQKAGEAVFIPAGCAHQVRNLSDCIKVAIDFVSPENIQRCEKLTREFREQNQRKAWKEDVLQLRTMMWFAWLSCCRQEKLAPF